MAALVAAGCSSSGSSSSSASSSSSSTAGASSTAAAAGGSAFGTPKKATGTPYTFGMINDETGAVTFPEARQGAIAAVDYVIELAGEDHVGIGSDASQGHGRPSAFMEWCNKDKGYARVLTPFGTDRVVKPLGPLAELGLIPVTIDADTNTYGWSTTLRLAERFSLTTYDAAYLELAQRHSLPLATLDQRLRAAATALGIKLLGAAA